MSEIFTLDSTVSYWDVDRDQLLTLGGVFRLLQEAAIKHADRYDLGTKAMAAQGESWVLNRIAAMIARYPRYEERVTVRTWSAGIRGFRGYRDLRIVCGDEVVLSASSLWLYVNLKSKALTRVPAELADRFPVGEAEVFRADLDRVRYETPTAGAPTTEISLRYGDVDGNAHLNNTAYFDTLQTALSRQGQPPRPREIEVQFLKEVPLAATAISVALEPREKETRIAWRSGGELNAQGVVRF
jgi:medium-chain acyl-[acyl-carrier-protein] hydrolase